MGVSSHFHEFYLIKKKRVLTSSVVDRGFKPKTIKLVFVVSPLSTEH